MYIQTQHLKIYITPCQIVMFRPLNIFLFLFCSIIFVVRVECTVRGVHPALQFSPDGQPGLKIRLTQKTLDYINQLAADFLNEKLVLMKIPTIVQSVRDGTVTVSKVSVLNVKPADEYRLKIKKPNTVIWKMRNMDIGVKGDLSGKVKVVLQVNLKGTSTIQAKGVDFSISNSLIMDATGRPQIKTTDCKASVREVSVHIKGGGLFGLVVNGLKNTVAEQFKPILEQALCSVTREFIDVKANEKLKTMPVRLPLNKKVFNLTNLDDLDQIYDQNIIQNGQDQINPSIADISTLTGITFNKADSLINSLWIDYRLLSEPFVTEDYIETLNHGEISWQGKGESPFHPPSIHEPEFKPDRMFYVYATDFVPNSLLYHAYRRRLLDVTLTPEDPVFGSYMRTTCFDDLFSFCLGDTLEPLATAFPDRELELSFQPLRAPAMMFNRNGQINLDVKGVVFIFVRDEDIPGKKEQVMALSVDMRADTNMTLSPNGSRVLGMAEVNRFLMSVRHSSIANVDNTQLKDISGYASDILGQLINEQLNKGLPLPLIAGASLVNPNLKVFDRFIMIQTDMDIDPNTIDILAADAFG